ncbi:DUF2332 domain-containing protein [Halobacillus fulvus]|nr:DUF2332 domain-containing protein [Halobacillus fulvus]
MMNTEELAERFKRFAFKECEGSSELYKQLSLEVADDRELLSLCLYAREGQPVPNLLFGAVHYLLEQETDHPLSNFYTSFQKEIRNEANAFPAFKDFCHLHKEQLIMLLQNKRVQTNEVRRCAYLYPLFCHIYRQTGKPLFLIEIGTSAGLQLFADEYSYSYGDGVEYENSEASVHISSHVRKGKLPADLLKENPSVQGRIGIDLHINDVTDPEDYNWLKALIWPEHQERRKMFEEAAQHIIQNPPHLIEGDGVKELLNVVENIPVGAVLCIFHTHVANQMPEKVKKELMENVDRFGETRDTYHIYNQVYDHCLHMDAYVNGKVQRQTIGETDGHGRWFDWELSIGEEWWDEYSYGILREEWTKNDKT